MADESKLFDYREARLPNGLHVITLADHSCPVVAVQLWYHVGSKDEDVARQGFAHMFEHMMFRGTDLLGPTDHFDLVRRTGGRTNAYTSFDQTVYHETLPAHQLELALWLEAQRMAFLRIDQESFDTERKVVEEERRRGLNRPFGSVYEQLMDALFEVHPYSWTPIGKIPHLRASSVAELRAFWNRYYVPNNATLVIAGDIAHDAAMKLVERHFGWIPPGDDPPRVDVTEPPRAQAGSVTIEEKNAPVPLVGLVYRTIPYAHDDYIPLELLTRILVGDSSSRLHRELVANRRLAVQTMNLSNALEQDGMLFAGAVLAPMAADPQQALDAMRAQIERLRSEPVTEREMLKARNQLLKQTVVRTLSVEGKAGVLARAAVLEGDVARVNQRLATIRRTNEEDLLRVAREYLSDERSLAVTVVRKATDDDETADVESPAPETNPPPPGRPGVARPAGYPVEPPVATSVEAKDLPPHSVHELENGLRVFVVPNAEQPFITVQLGLRAGAWTESKPGTASMTLKMLTQGTAHHTEAELADLLGTYAISLFGSGGMDSCSVSANCVSEQLPRTIDLLAEVVLSPSFPVEEFAKKRTETHTQLAQLAEDPEYLARRQLRRVVFGEHPYARTATGEVEDVDRLEIADLKDWWGRYARPDDALLIFAGDVAAERAVELARSAFGDWRPSGPKPETSLPELPAPGPTHIYLIDQPRATQSQIVVGQLGITRQHPRYAVSRLVSGYFGGAFNSRLNETIRVEKGLTYGARGGFAPQRFAGQFVVSTFSKTESTAEAVSAIFDELERLHAEAPSTVEIDDARSYILGSFQLERETPQQVASDLWTIEVNGLPDDYFQRQLVAVAAAAGSDCVELVHEAVDQERMVVVVVGNVAELRGDLEKIGPVTLVGDTGS